MKNVICHNPQSLILSLLTGWKHFLHKKEVQSLRLAIDSGKKIFKSPLEMTNNGHSSTQGHNFTYQVRNFMSKQTQNARA